MIRLTNLRTLACGIAVATVACTSKSDNAQDSAIAVTGDTTISASTAPSAGAPSTTTPTGGAVASTTAGGGATPAQPNHSIDLNTATDAQILSIPGVGQRMLHEFKEYRPYTSMDQFRREIGKYVDKAEVARLEQYVTIKK